MENRSNSLKNRLPEERPREKMLIKGSSSLSDVELVAVLLNHGTKCKSSLDIAREVLDLCDNNLSELGKLSLHDLQRIYGVGSAKAVTIAAAMELGRRRDAAKPGEKTIIRCSADMAGYLKPVLKDLPYEVFAVMFLNQANRVKHFEIVSRGGITGTVADPRLILKKALETNSTSLILSHNHPSGSLRPSQADENLTHKLKNAASYFDIRILDHIIVSEEGYYSFADDGRL